MLRVRRHSVLSLVGPSSGTCSPGCSVTLNALFNPLTSGEHSVDVLVTIGGDTDAPSRHTLTIRGRGVHPERAEQAALQPAELARDSRALAGWHEAPLVATNALLAASEAAIRFGATEPTGVMRRVVLLRACGPRAVRLRWDCGELAGGGAGNGVLTVEPATDELLPGEAILCQLTYVAGSEAQILDAEVAVYAEALTEDEARALRPGALLTEALSCK